jgi:tetratricopeptide (TPR) repeat protein
MGDSGQSEEALYLDIRTRLCEGRFTEALSLLRPVASEAGASAQCHLYLAVAHEGLHEYDEAIRHYEEAWKLDANPLVVANLGGALLAAGRPGQAVDVLERALATGANVALVHYQLGQALVQLGAFERARHAFEAALRLEPCNTGVHKALADIKTFTREDPQLHALANLATATTSMDEEAQVHLHFALGKAYEDVGDYASSFRHLTDGNRLVRGRFHYDEQAALSVLAEVRKSFSADFVRGYPSAAPIFVLGMPRSGSTLVERILSAHPAVRSAGETSLFGELARDWFPAGGLRQELRSVIQGISGEQLYALGKNYVAAMQRAAPGAEMVIDKLPSNYLLLGLIHLALPNAHVIHTRRDALDTCLSCFATHFAGTQAQYYDLGELGRHYRAYEGLMNHWRDVLPRGTFLEVQYERLINESEQEIRRMLQYCGLEWDEACRNFFLSPLPVRTASAAQVRKPLYRGSVGRASRFGKLLEPLKVALDGSSRDPLNGEPGLT